MCVCMYVHACMHTCLNVGTCIDSHMHISNQDKLRDPIFKRVRDSDGGFLNTKRAYVISSQQKQKKSYVLLRAAFFVLCVMFGRVRGRMCHACVTEVSRVRHGSVTRVSRKMVSRGFEAQKLTNTPFEQNQRDKTQKTQKYQFCYVFHVYFRFCQIRITNSCFIRIRRSRNHTQCLDLRCAYIPSQR